MSEPYYAIVNGAAGGGKCRSRFDAALGRLREAGLELEIELTEGPGHATELAREGWERGWRRFLSVGGDGTSYEIINGLFPNEGDERPVLGILPLGTGNSFLRDFGILTEEAAIAALARDRTTRCDVVRCEHAGGTLCYLNLLAIGFAARAGEMTNERFKPLGAGGYAAAVLLCIARLEYPVDPVKLDGGPADARPAAFLSFSNSRYTGGSMMMAPQADPTDGELDVIRCGPLPRGRFMATFPKIFRGTHIEVPDIEQTRARRVDFEQDREQPAMIDGEIVRLSLRSLEVVPGALEVIT